MLLRMCAWQWNTMVRLYSVSTDTVTGEMGESFVKGNLMAAVKCILDIQIACEGRVELDEDTKKNSLEVHLEYVGDIHLGFAIQTFEEAVRAVREMFTKQTKSTATSVSVHLLPLTVLDNGASRFVAQIEHLGCLERNLRKHPRLRDVLRELTDHRGPQHFRKLSENIADVLSKLGSKSAEFVSMAMGQVRELKSGAGSEQSPVWAYPRYVEFSIQPFLFGRVGHGHLPNTLWHHMGQCKLPRMLPILNARSTDADHALILEIGMGDQGKDLVVKAVRAWIQQPGSSVEHVQRDFTFTDKRKKLFLKFVAGRGVSGVPTVLLATKILRGRPITELSASITKVEKNVCGMRTMICIPTLEILLYRQRMGTRNSAGPLLTVARLISHRSLWGKVLRSERRGDFFSSEQRTLGDCWQWNANGQCSKGDNCSFRHDVKKRAKSTQPNSSPSSSTRQNERNASRTRSPRGKSPSGRMSRWPCKDYLKGTCTNLFCEKWHPPECSASLRMDADLGSCAHRQVEEQPSKRSSKEWWQKCSGYAEKYTTIGLRISGYGAAEVFIDFAEELRHTETNPMCSIYKSRRTSC